jgi:hypothetical protein
VPGIAGHLPTLRCVRVLNVVLALGEVEGRERPRLGDASAAATPRGRRPLSEAATVLIVVGLFGAIFVFAFGVLKLADRAFSRRPESGRLTAAPGQWRAVLTISAALVLAPIVVWLGNRADSAPLVLVLLSIAIALVWWLSRKRRQANVVLESRADESESSSVKPFAYRSARIWDRPDVLEVGELFKDFDLQTFWEKSEYAEEEYVDDPLTRGKVEFVERTLGYRLPAAYIALMKSQNGGIPKRTNHRTAERTSWAEDHIAITGIYGIGNAKPCSLCGQSGNQLWLDEWEYPPIGVYFADCPSGGHDMLCLDYRECGPEGEPAVVHVDQESDFKITLVAKNFETFIRGLQGDEEFDD